MNGNLFRLNAWSNHLRESPFYAKIDRIIDVGDNSAGLLQRRPARIENSISVACDVTVDPNQLDKLRKDGSPFDLSVEVEADSSALGFLGGMGMMPAGFVAAVSLASKTKVKGIAKVVVEFPHPHIWHPFLDRDSDPTSLLIDTNERVVPCEAHLRRYVPANKRYEKRAEELLVEVDEDKIGDQLAVVVVDDDRFYIKTKRVLIGRKERDAGTVLSRREFPKYRSPYREHRPRVPAKNQPTAVPLKYKPYTATLGIQLELEGAVEDNPVLYKEIGAERVTLAWPDLHSKTEGTVKWEITDGPRRLREAGSGFCLGGTEGQNWGACDSKTALNAPE